MRKIMLVVVILFSALYNVQGQNQKSFMIKANWQKNEVKEMIDVRSISFVRNGAENSTSNDTAARYQITIIDKNKYGYSVEWKYVYEPMDKGKNKFMDKYVSQFSYVFRTDTMGNFVELANWKKLSKLNKKLRQKTISEAKKNNASQQELDALLAQMAIAETKPELTEECKSLADILLNSYGTELPLNDTSFEQTVIPNENIKIGIPATIKTVTTDLGNDLIRIRYETIYDPEKIKELFIEAFPGQEYIEEKTISISEFVYNCKTGWIERIRFYNENVSTEISHKSVHEYIFK